MVNIIRTGRTSTSPPRNGEVGEIDTRAPFQSVRAAVTLFGMVKAKRPPEKAAVPKKTTPETEGVLDKEAQYHLTQKELEKYKEDLKNAEAVATEALPQLQKATRTLEDLKDKLKVVNESKLAILEATESLKMKAEMLEESKTNNQQENADILRNHQNVEESRAEYKAAAAELDAAKQELSKLRSDFNASIEEKETAYNKAEEARTTAQTHSEKVKELSEQIKHLQTSLSRVKRASQNSVQEYDKILADKGSGIEIRRKAKEEAENKITSLREEMNTLLLSYGDPSNMESNITQTNAEIKVVREDLEAAKAALSEAERIAIQELDAAKETLSKLVDEKNSVQAMVNSLETELRNAQQEKEQSKNNEAESESLAGKLKAELEDKKKELKQAIESEETTASVSEEITSKVEQLVTKTRKAKEEAEEMKQNAEKVKRGAKNFEEMAVEMRTSLDLVLNEAEQAKEADKKAQEWLRKTKDEARSMVSSPSMVPTTDEKTIVPVPEKLVNKVVRTEEEEVRRGLSLDCKSRSEAEEQIDAILKEIDEIKVATGEALKQAEKAEMAQKIVEVELRKRNDQRQ